MSEHPRDLTHLERRKLGFLVSTYQTVYDCWRYDVMSQSDDFEEAADKAGWHFDWTPVIRECFPDVLVIMDGQDRRKRLFPVYAVIPGAGEWFEIHSNPDQLELLKGVAVLPSRDGDGDGSPLDQLRMMITSLPTDRRGEAEKHLRALRRIIAPSH